MRKRIKIFADLKQALEGARDYEHGQGGGLKVTELPPPPKPLSPQKIKSIRIRLDVSQINFAKILNVSPNTVESWEQGSRHPNGAALKLLNVATKAPEALLQA